jgi:hypothetical protein
MLSFAFSLLLSFVTSITAVAPAGITAPLLPVTGSLSVAVNLSPILFVFVQTLADDARVSVEPEAIIPTSPAELFSPGVTVLPDAVRGGVVAAGVVGRGVAGLGAGVRGRVVEVGVLGVGAGAAAGGTSWSCG